MQHGPNHIKNIHVKTMLKQANYIIKIKQNSHIKNVKVYG